MDEYKPIFDFNNYEISNSGNVRNKKTHRVLNPSIDCYGYYKVNLYKDNKHFNKMIHKLVADAFLENTDNKPQVDHINNDRLDNNLNNLRWVTNQENQRNRKLNTKNTSGVKGVTFDKANNKWKAQITIDGICIFLGRFDNIEDAKQARITEANEVFGIYKNACEN